MNVSGSGPMRRRASRSSIACISNSLKPKSNAEVAMLASQLRLLEVGVQLDLVDRGRVAGLLHEPPNPATAGAQPGSSATDSRYSAGARKVPSSASLCSL